MDNSFLHRKKLLLVDDEPDLLKMVSDILSDANFDKYCNAINENAQYLSKTIEDFRDFIQEDRDKNYPKDYVVKIGRTKYVFPEYSLEK